MKRLTHTLAGLLLASGTLAFQPAAQAHGGGFGHWPGDHHPVYGHGYAPPVCRIQPVPGHYRHRYRHDYDYDHGHHRRHEWKRHHGGYGRGRSHHTGYAAFVFYY